jgi:hypothetical protein
MHIFKTRELGASTRLSGHRLGCYSPHRSSLAVTTRGEKSCGLSADFPALAFGPVLRVALPRLASFYRSGAIVIHFFGDRAALSPRIKLQKSKSNAADRMQIVRDWTIRPTSHQRGLGSAVITASLLKGGPA